jgi:hypothetical protein
VSVSTELVDLVISLLHSATFLLDPAAISDLQAAVCRATASDPTPPLSVFRLLNTLLSHNHDLVPLPLQVFIFLIQK